MSDSYAARLSHYPNKGICGLPESIDSSRVFQMKLKQLKILLGNNNESDNHNENDNRKRIVFFTGAGISTSAGIPDFRGPKGIWTVEKEKKRKRNRAKEDSSTAATKSMDFSAATPTLTHRAITRLILDGHAHFCVTQNVDGLHRRSGLPRNNHSVLHGCVFTETCDRCHTEYFRDFEVGGSRKCEECGGALCDTLLDWEDPLPEDDFDRSNAHCQEADLVICLGTSLRIQPAGSMPAMAKDFVIVNLQETPEDKNASLVIRERADKVVLAIMEHFGYGQDWREIEKAQIESVWTPPKQETS